MRLTIFSRLILSFLVLLIMATAVSMYSILQLGRVNEITRSIILRDNALLDLHKNLADALLSESRYEQKFAILQDPALHQNFLTSKADFQNYLDQAIALADSPEVKNILAELAELHRAYQEMFETEVISLTAGDPYPKESFGEEKKRLVNEALAEIAKLRTLSQQNIFRKIGNLGEAGNKARTVAIVITGIALLCGIILAVSITASITVPLSRMKKKTGEIARGVFETDLDLPSAPEIEDLAQAFNTMCAKLKEVDRLKSDFYSLMSHELRTPLTSIREGTNLFLEGLGGEITEKQRRLLSIIAEESNRLIELVNSLLDLSKLEAGMVTFHFGKAELQPLITQAVREIMPLAEAKGIDLAEDAEVVPAVVVDTERFLQALRNLLGNALKFTPQGGAVRIVSRCTPEGVEISVSDTGAGIPEEHREVIFEKFRQSSQAGSRRLLGTGLGLAIVKQIINAHGGRVWVESEVGRGSTFYLVLPA